MSARNTPRNPGSAPSQTEASLFVTLMHTGRQIWQPSRATGQSCQPHRRSIQCPAHPAGSRLRRPGLRRNRRTDDLPRSRHYPPARPHGKAAVHHPRTPKRRPPRGQNLHHRHRPANSETLDQPVRDLHKKQFERLSPKQLQALAAILKNLYPQQSDNCEGTTSTIRSNAAITKARLIKQFKHSVEESNTAANFSQSN